MKTAKKFSKGFLPCAIISGVIIIFGIVGLFTKGINLGLDFKPGLVEEVRITKPAATITYDGSANITVTFGRSQLDVVITGAGIANETKSYVYSDYASLDAIAAEMNKIDGVKVSVADGSCASDDLILNSAVSNQLTTEPLYVYPASVSENDVERVRKVLGTHGVDVKMLGTGTNVSYQLRTGVDKNISGDANSEEAVQSAVTESINEKLYNEFGKENVVTVKQDFTNPSMSKTTTIKSIIMFVCVILLIWLYAAIRFHWDFALGSIIALLHDACIMFTFIIWTNMEFSSTVLAAVLTIMGYSINATVVILDRLRYNMKMMPKEKSFKGLLDQALTDTFLRSVLTTLTTLFAVISLFIFTTGSIKDFSLAMIVGLISGMYSSIFISSGFIALVRKNWKPEYGVHHSLKTAKKSE